MNIIVYLLQVTACTAVFYSFYFMFLNRLTFFATNRWYLLVTVLLSFLIPCLRITLNEQQPYIVAVQHIIYAPEAIQQHVQSIMRPMPEVAEPIHWDSILRATYLTMAAVLCIHLILTLLSFFKRIKGKRIAKIGRIKILSGQQKMTNGSFLNYIFLNDGELRPDEIAQIVAHEMLHIKFYHSIDRILIKIAQIILWFNPFIYLYQRSVEENHEFEVDREMASTIDKHNYANLLLHLSVAKQQMLYHNFSKVPLNKRISMLFSKPSKKMKRIIYVLIIPVVLVSCLAFARMKKMDVTISTHNENTYAGKSVNGQKAVSSPEKKLSFGKKTGNTNRPTKVAEYIISNTKNDESDSIKQKKDLPNDQYYKRRHFKNDDGTYYDQIVIYIPPDGEVMRTLSPNGKPGFIIDRKIYNEEEFRKILPSVVKLFTSNYGTGDINNSSLNHGLDVSGYDVIFSFNTENRDDSHNVRKTDLTENTKSILEKMSAFEKGKGKELPE